MKKVLKSRIFVAIITAIVCITGTTYAATQILASNVTYKETTVEDALDDLYNISNKSICRYTYSGNTLKKYTCDDNKYIKKFWYQLDASNGRFSINDLSIAVGDKVYFDFIINLTQSVNLSVEFNDVNVTPTATNLGGSKRRYSGYVTITQQMVDSSRGFDYSNLRFIDLSYGETAPYTIDSAVIYYEK